MQFDIRRFALINIILIIIIIVSKQIYLYRFDIYRKVPKDLTQPTNTGAAISICCVLFILFLLISEFVGFIVPEV